MHKKIPLYKQPRSSIMSIQEMGQAARLASLQMSALDSKTKDNAILAIANALQASAPEIEAANRLDLDNAAALPLPIQKRLAFSGKKIAASIEGLQSLASLPNPAGITQKATELDNGLELFRVSCPIGVIGVVFESRPDALVQISTLCLKSGNAVLLKGGREALNSNRILAKIVHGASIAAGIPDGWIQLLETREDVSEMLKLEDCIDLIIPRGSNAFVKYIMDNTNIPVMGHADGICHVYVDKEADIDMAVSIAVDSKCQYVAVCNAMETLLVHEDIAKDFIPKAADALKAKGVALRGCPKTCAITPMEQASDKDWDTEYLDYILSIKVVHSIDEAIAHINRHGSGHTDAIVTASRQAAAQFTALVDSADAFWNCSTRFADGYRFGLGAEVGISTAKIHARGPVGLDGLCIYKWILCGNGHVVSDYAEGAKRFTHKNIASSINDKFNW